MFPALNRPQLHGFAFLGVKNFEIFDDWKFELTANPPMFAVAHYKIFEISWDIFSEFWSFFAFDK